MTRFLDVRSLPCPGPVVELRKALEAGETDVRLHVGDDLARSNVTRFAASRGARATSEPHPDGGFLVAVEVPGVVDAPQAPPAGEVPDPPSGSRVVQIASRTMGVGDDDLGAVLVRAFLKTLATVEPKPDVIVCYNTGVHLCCEGSPVLDDLRAHEAAGVTVLACGTCLNFFGMAGRLAVGRVTDMLEIATTLSRAGHVIRP